MDNNTMLRIEETALAAFIEELIQSVEGPSEDDMEYIRAERERIRLKKLAAA